MEFNPAKRMEALPFSGIRAILEKANKMQAAGDNIIHLEIGRPDFDSPRKVKETAYEEIEKGNVFYTSNYGTPELRSAIAEFEKKKNGVQYDPSEVLVTVGVCEATWNCMFACLDPEDEVLVPNPVWLNYIHVPTAFGAKPVSYSLKEENDFQIDVDELERLVTEKTKMLVIVDPSNPIGGVFSGETLEKVAAFAIKHDLIVLSDEIYEHLVYDGAKHTSIGSLPGMKERTMKLGGFSKAYSMTGWRLGYMCAPKEFIAAVVRVHQYNTVCASSFVQKAAVTALKECDDDVENMRREYERRKNYLVRTLNEIDGISCNDPKGAFYILVNIKALGMSSMDVSDYLLEKAKIATVPGSAFGSEGEGYIRISYATAYEQLVEACERIRKAVVELNK
ncbi:MAG: pyridoxal phosphate-dependent aminotransferase [Lachnospiraceae bacterium]|nr:pyridoxal phosphate-dependent aminotransferase [Lachnospiraceae bacterium]